jgi:hypothetical protein
VKDRQLDIGPGPVEQFQERLRIGVKLLCYIYEYGVGVAVHIGSG